MHYTLHQLQVFLKVSETLSITKAADELHLSQPAVSIQIKNLQDQFEVPLLEVIGRKVFVTEFGKDIAAAANRIIEEVNTINSKAAAYNGQLIGKLKISVVSTGKYVMPYFLSDFIHRNPGIELVLDVTNRARVMGNLEKNEVDFALVSLLPSKLQVEAIDLMDNELFVVGNKGNKFQEFQKRNFLTKVPLIFRESGSGTRMVMEKFLNQYNLKVDTRLELTSNEAVKQAVIAGLGYSIMPLIGIRHELGNGDLQIIPVEGFPVKSVWRLVWIKKKNLSPVATAYKNYIEQEKDNIIQQQFQDVKNVFQKK